MNQDLQHLKLLSIFFYVVGGLLALFSCFALIYLLMGVAFVAAPPPSGGGGPPPAALGWFFIVFSAGVLLLGWSWAACLMFAGWYLGQCKHYIYCLVMGCTACLFNPFGTILGVFTIIVLIRPSVKRRFETGGLPDESDERDEPRIGYDDHLPRNSSNIRNDALIPPNTETSHPSAEAASSMRKSPSRSTSTSIKRRPFSAVAAEGSPRPVLALTRCQGRVMLIQPRLMASKRGRPGRPVVGQLRMHQVRKERQSQAGFHLVGVLARLLEQLRIQVAQPCETSRRRTGTRGCDGAAGASAASARCRRGR